MKMPYLRLTLAWMHSLMLAILVPRIKHSGLPWRRHSVIATNVAHGPAIDKFPHTGPQIELSSNQLDGLGAMVEVVLTCLEDSRYPYTAAHRYRAPP